ncbi:MAG: IS200/IS605 family transposase [Actinomycetota bacterium]|nr:IS200/IS605 family transposase [Actinomycetota bacterium]
MANTYTQLYIHLVFAVANRTCLIKKDAKEEIQKYITGIVQNKGNKLLAINAMRDHIHIFIGLHPSIAISDLVRDIKVNSTNFINDKKLIRGKFNWQEGFGAFSYSRSQIKSVILYIEKQEEHHKRKSFKEEFIKILKDFDVEYKNEHLFKWIDTD